MCSTQQKGVRKRMEDSKETMNEQAVNDAAEKAPVIDMPEIKAESTAAKPDNTGKRGGSTVTKKFLVLALAATVLINAGVTAGVMALTARHDSHGRPDMHGGSHPGSEMFSHNMPGGNGQMTPPQNGQNNGHMSPPQNGQNDDGQKTLPGDSQNNTQDQSANGTEKDS